VHSGPRGTRTLRTMAFFVAATTTNKIDNYTTPWDVTNVARPLIRGTAEGGMTGRA